MKPKIKPAELKTILEEAYLQFAQKEFIEHDPLRLVYEYQRKEDREIAGLFAAIFAWGKRSIIIAKTSELMARMDHAPYEFIQHPGLKKLKVFKGFVHRTFLEEDVKSFAIGLHTIYESLGGLESVFSGNSEFINKQNSPGMRSWMGIQAFRHSMIQSPGFAIRSHKHLANPEQGSAAKRLHLFLRWMVRKDAVDTGLWTHLIPSDLNCPLDVHTARVGRALGLFQRNQNDLRAVEELTQALRLFCPEDPVKYDLALFGLGEMGVY